MKTVTVKYNLPGKPPRGAVMEKFVAAANGMFKGMNGLLNKQFTYDEKSGDGLSVYLWETSEMAETFHSESFVEHFKKTFGVKPTITHHDLLTFVDNRTGDILTNNGESAQEADAPDGVNATMVSPVLDSERRTVLITGSNRGIGLGLAKQYAANGWNVIATTRNPDSAMDLQELAGQSADVHIEALDVVNETELAQLAKKYSNEPIDVLIHNAAFHGGEPEDNLLGSYAYDTFARYMAVNTFAPLKVSEAFLESVKKSKQKKIITITSFLSSLTFAPPISGGTFQLASKAGVNRAMRTLQHELRDDGVIVGLVSPGKVDTDGLALASKALAAGRIAPPSGGAISTLSIESAVGEIVKVIAGLDDTYDGSHLDLRGNVIPW